MLLLYTTTLFLSAFLLFWVQLFVAKLLLPLLGGSPSLWNTCMCFFQTVLLLGYSYAHLTSQRLSPQQQTWVQGLVVCLPLPFLPIALHPERLQAWGLSPVASNPILWVLLALTLTVGLPFFVISTSAPLLQQWFSQTQHPRSQDPYFLYAASNSGSLLGLLAYPFVLEPNLTLSQQGQVWSLGYGLFLLLSLSCALARRPWPLEKTLPAIERDFQDSPHPSWRQQGRWVLFAFIPTSLLLGVTTYLTTDIAAIPLLWALPLAIYLITFILAFARQPLVSPQRSRKFLPLLPPLTTALLLLLLLKVTHPTLLVLPLHLLGLGILALAFHGELARSRPAAADLTRFYLCISLGGVLAGWFNALLAPLAFTTLLEYPLLLLISLLLLKTLDPQPFASSSLRVSLPLSFGLVVGGLLMGWSGQAWQAYLPGTLTALALWLLVSWLLDFKKLPLSVGCLLLILLSQFSINSLGGILVSQRSFFGVYQVLQDPQGQYNTLLHGTTVHGRQNYHPSRQGDPLTYFTRTGPMGQVFSAWNQQHSNRPRTRQDTSPKRVAVLGLGVGTLAAYAQPGQDWTFYEIDPLVTQLAQNPTYFSFLANAPILPKVVTGDARLQLQTTPAAGYDLIVMDAFSSDAIPVHLVTREALELYLQKLSAQGWIVVNITNRHLDLSPVLARLAQELGLTAISQYDRQISDAEQQAGKAASRWVVLSRHRQDLGSLQTDPRWQTLQASPSAPLWSDDFSNLWQIWRRD